MIYRLINSNADGDVDVDNSNNNDNSNNKILKIKNLENIDE